MRFTKMHGLGNDFIIVVRDQPLSQEDFRLAPTLCNRRLGIGADGVVFILPSSQADFSMRIINADGSYTEQCGNALRCAAKYYYESISDAKEKLLIETEVGLQPARLTVQESKVAEIQVDMGPPVIAEAMNSREKQVQVEGKPFRITKVSMGNPHGVVFVEDVSRFPVEKWGPRLELHSLFPEKANIEFVTVHNPKKLEMRVWERGVGRTLACGSGACASVVAGVLTGRTERSVIVHLEGGRLRIEWSSETGHVYMSGPAEKVFDGWWGD